MCICLYLLPTYRCAVSTSSHLGSATQGCPGNTCLVVNVPSHAVKPLAQTALRPIIPPEQLCGMSSQSGEGEGVSDVLPRFRTPSVFEPRRPPATACPETRCIGGGEGRTTHVQTAAAPSAALSLYITAVTCVCQEERDLRVGGRSGLQRVCNSKAGDNRAVFGSSLLSICISMCSPPPRLD